MNNGSASARSSDTSALFESRSPSGASLPVPRLAPGGSRTGSGSFRVDFGTWEFGTYPTRICADLIDAVTESDEENNCAELEPIHLVPTVLTGRVTGKSNQFRPFKTSSSAGPPAPFTP